MKLDISRSKKTRLVIPARFKDLFHELPVLPHENRLSYLNLVTELGHSSGAQDFVDWIYVKQCADLIWDILRYRREKISLLKSSHRGALQKMISERMLETMSSDSYGLGGDKLGPTEVEKLAQEFYDDPSTKKKILKRFAAEGLNESDIAAAALTGNLSKFEALERLIVGAEIRLDRSLAAMEGRRERLAERLRPSSVQMIAQETVEAEIVDESAAGRR